MIFDKILRMKMPMLQPSESVTGNFRGGGIAPIAEINYPG
jgi:hypothetical protein